MASGLALISTGVGGASEVFENEISGLSYPTGNSRALAEQLERLARDPRLTSSTSKAGEETSKRTNSALTHQHVN